MKLNQLGLTPAGQKATKKLGSQVHKATVAAAMEPKLKLGVIGIEIGQEQSKGPTSITESMPTVDVTQPVTDEHIALLLKLAKVLKYRKELPPADMRGAWQLGIQIGRLYDADQSQYANEANDLVLAVMKAAKDNVTSQRSKELLKLGVNGGVVGEVANAFVKIADSHEAMLKEVLKMDLVLNFVDHFTGLLQDDDSDSFDRKMVIGVCKRLGIPTE